MKKAFRETAGIALLLLTVLSMVSCGRKTVYEEFREFGDMGWNRFEDQDFEFNIENTSASYDIKLFLVFRDNFGHRTFTFDTRIVTPDGEERAMTHKMHLNQLGPADAEAAPGNFKEGSVFILQDYRFEEKGTAKVKVQNRMSNMRTPGILEIGLVVEQH